MPRRSKITPYRGTQLELFPVPHPKDIITTCSGDATVTRTEQLGLEVVIWADYGNGVEHPHQPQAIQKCRRYSRPGHASGWIEERIGNRKRSNPTVSYYYCWQDSPTGRRKKLYIPARKLWKIQQMVEVQHCPIAEVLAVLCPID
jgi:hypothetical protein